MEETIELFNERVEEVGAYLEFLKELDKATKSGAPRFEGSGTPISTTQTKILFSSLYLQLYNLVEATMSSCIDSVANAAFENPDYKPNQLSENLFKQWIRLMARTHADLSPEHRLDHAIELCAHLANALPVKDLRPLKIATETKGLTIEKGGGGNWDHKSIDKFSLQLGFKLTLSPKTRKFLNNTFSEDLGPISLIKHYRNKLAHGNISFTQSAENITVSRLEELTKQTITYMEEVVECFDVFIHNHEFLKPDQRPS